MIRNKYLFKMLAIGLLVITTAVGVTACGSMPSDNKENNTETETENIVNSNTQDEATSEVTEPYIYENGVLTINHTEDVLRSDETWSQYAKEARKIVIAEGIIKLSNDCFKDCTNLEEVVLPSTLTEIGWKVFMNCGKLDNVVLPEGLIKLSSNAFSDCASLTKITLSSKTTYIDYRAFYNCTSLEEIVIPDTINYVSEFAFENCPVDAKINLPASVMKRQPIEKAWVTKIINLLLKNDFVTVENEVNSLGTDMLEVMRNYGKGYKSEDGTTLKIRIRQNDDGSYWWAVYYTENEDHNLMDYVGYGDKYCDSDGGYCTGTEAFGEGMLSPMKLDEENDVWIVWEV